ncbi:predicted protein [Chaetomium globosum CBS 148.51]|uniref:Uncharacterized protein n=1 Tax=Chaetomium globosum (strain ATCC 6205 / CBS 148.51 / DSM 1962 / NBRC 6347 / NRRL 1970) TaxID=306901 RepID=Q2HI17_CHAGB|nr:uncharacterized protein CHGG_00137 [Chaetomium globosum CBS 148.51]EAQ91902.1 predicted protein [Chaetomium globosum CBS 148.51]
MTPHAAMPPNPWLLDLTGSLLACGQVGPRTDAARNAKILNRTGWRLPGGGMKSPLITGLHRGMFVVPYASRHHLNSSTPPAVSSIERQFTTGVSGTMAAFPAAAPLIVSASPTLVRWVTVAVAGIPTALLAADAIPKIREHIQGTSQPDNRVEPAPLEPPARKSESESGPCPAPTFEAEAHSNQVTSNTASIATTSEARAASTNEARAATSPDAVMPDAFELRPSRAARSVSVTYEEGGSWRIELPFPWSIGVAAGYLLYTAFASSNPRSPAAGDSTISSAPRSRSSPPAPSKTTVNARGATVTPPTPPSEDGSDSDEYPEAGRKELKKLLEAEGKEIYEKLKATANTDHSPGASRKVWKNKDFRIDNGHRDDKRGVRHWEFQVNGDAQSTTAKRIRGGSRRGTHQKLFKDTFELKNPPGFEEWKTRVMALLD